MAGHWVEGLRSGGLYGVLLRGAHVASVEVILGRNGGHVIIRTGSTLYFPPTSPSSPSCQGWLLVELWLRADRNTVLLNYHMMCILLCCASGITMIVILWMIHMVNNKMV